MSNHSVIITLTAIIIFTSIAYSQTVNSSLFSCFSAPANPSKSDVLSLINLTASENTYGACALAALSSYNSSNVLLQYNISVNLTQLNTRFFNENPVLPTAGDSKAVVANSTFLNVSTPGRMCIRYTPESSNASPNANRTHIQKCTPGQTKIADIIVNVTAPNTTIMVLPPPSGNTIVNSSPLNFTASSSSSINSDPSEPNWVGYQIGTTSNQTVREVQGSWIVQPALSSDGERFSLQWIGISDSFGFGMIQIETASCFENALVPMCRNPFGAAYGAQLQYVDTSGVVHDINQSAFNFAVEAGDKISASITILSNSSSGPQSFEADICDTRGSTTVCSPLITGIETIYRTNAEWIDERPTVLGQYSAFTNFVNASFGIASTGILDSATITNGYPEGINEFPNQNRNILVMSNNNDYGNSANVTNLNGSSFKVRNFRIGNLVASQQTVNSGQKYTIQLITESVSNSALGGTGGYIYQWFENKGSGYSTSTDCNFFILSSEEANCTVNSAQVGNYSFKLQVTPIGGPYNEAINSTPITITVKPSIISIPITLSNNQNSATSSPFQQMLIIDSEAFSGINSNWNNVEFTTGSGATGTPLQAWVESNASSSSTHTIVWVNLPYGISGYGSTTIYLNIMPNPIMSSSGPTGEAPQLSPTYAEYDNGASVFNFYDNFKGTSLSSSWTHTTNAAASVNNGLGITFSGLDAYFVTNSHYGVGTAFDSDITYFEDNSSLAANSTNETDPDDMGYINIYQPQSRIGNSGWSASVIRAACNNLYPTQISPSGEDNSCGSVFGAFAYGHVPIGIYTVNPITSSSSWQYVGYSTAGTRQPITGDAPNYPASIGFAQMSYGPYTNRITAQWVRVRNAPPNGIMPIATDPNSSVK